MGNLGAQQARIERRSCASGWYSLEFAMSLVTVGALILGVFDVARIFHARSAVRAGVSDGLRCLYPLAEDCSSGSPDVNTASYSLYRSTFDAPGGFDLPRSSYSLSATWFTQPVLQAPLVRTALASAQVSYTREAFREYNVRFPVDAHAMYLVQTRDLPRVNPHPDARLRPNQRILKATFTDRLSGAALSGDSASHKRLAISHIGGKTRSTHPQLIGEVAFSLSDAWPHRDNDLAKLASLRRDLGFSGAIPCYQGTWRGMAEGPRLVWSAADEPTQCGYHGEVAKIFDGADLLVPIMMRIKGERFGTSNDSFGTVTAVLEFQRGKQVVSWPLDRRT